MSLHGDRQVASAENLAGFWEFPSRVMSLPFELWPDLGVSISDAGTISSLTRNATLLREPNGNEVGLIANAVRRFFGQATSSAAFSINSHWPSHDFSDFGYSRNELFSVMWRMPGPLKEEAPSDLLIKEVDTPELLWAWENVFLSSFEMSAFLPYTPGRLFDERILGHDCFKLWVGMVDNQVVSTSTSYIDAEVVGIYNVGTLKDFRGHGYGTALASAAMLAASDLPTVLQAEPAIENIYERIGFHVTGKFTFWRSESD